MKPKLLLLSNLRGPHYDEDFYLAELLRTYFDVTLLQTFAAHELKNSADVVLMRNVGPTQDKDVHFTELYTQLEKAKIPVYNAHHGAGNMQGKFYLSQLWQAGYPVIPTVNNKEELNHLPVSKNYIAKPMYDDTADDVKKLTVTGVAKANLLGYVVQPFVKIKQKIYCYFIDGLLQYSLSADTPKNNWKLWPYTPTTEQLAVAQKFVLWNTLSYGIQRISLCVIQEDQIVLLEIDDWCPHLYLLEIPRATRNHFIKNLSVSLRAHCKNSVLTTPDQSPTLL